MNERVCNDALVMLGEGFAKHRVMLGHLDLGSPPRPAGGPAGRVPDKLIPEPLKPGLVGHVAQLLGGVEFARREQHDPLDYLGTIGPIDCQDGICSAMLLPGDALSWGRADGMALVQLLHQALGLLGLDVAAGIAAVAFRDAIEDSR